MPKIERKYLAHFLDAKFGVKTQGEETYAPNYTRLGKDLEEYNEELNPDVEVNKNILGEQNVVHNGYEVQSEVDPFYAYSGDPLFERLAKIANERLTGDDCMTTKVDVLLNSDGTVAWAYREDVWVVPESVGGDTSGVQIPFTVYNAGNRVKGTFDLTTKTFTADTNAAGYSSTPSTPPPWVLSAGRQHFEFRRQLQWLTNWYSRISMKSSSTMAA